MIKEIARVILHFMTFCLSFYCLSGLDLSKVMLKGPQRNAKAMMLLILMSLALGYLSAQFILAIIVQIG